MTHDMKQQDVQRSFTPMSLQEPEKPIRLEMTLEQVVLQDGKEFLSAFLEENHVRLQNDKAISSAIKDTTPGIRILGLMHSTPRV